MRHCRPGRHLHAEQRACRQVELSADQHHGQRPCGCSESAFQHGDGLEWRGLQHRQQHVRRPRRRTRTDPGGRAGVQGCARRRQSASALAYQLRVEQPRFPDLSRVGLCPRARHAFRDRRGRPLHREPHPAGLRSSLFVGRRFSGCQPRLLARGHRPQRYSHNGRAGDPDRGPGRRLLARSRRRCAVTAAQPSRAEEIRP